MSTLIRSQLGRSELCRSQLGRSEFCRSQLGRSEFCRSQLCRSEFCRSQLTCLWCQSPTIAGYSFRTEYTQTPQNYKLFRQSYCTSLQQTFFCHTQQIKQLLIQPFINYCISLLISVCITRFIFHHYLYIAPVESWTLNYKWRKQNVINVYSITIV